MTKPDYFVIPQLTQHYTWKSYPHTLEIYPHYAAAVYVCVWSKLSFARVHVTIIIMEDRWSSFNERRTKKKSESPWGMEPQTFGFLAPMLYRRLATETLVCMTHRVTNMTLSTLLILAVRKTLVTWNSLLTVESLWFSGRASESGIRRSEIRFLRIKKHLSLFL